LDLGDERMVICKERQNNLPIKSGEEVSADLTLTYTHVALAMRLDEQDARESASAETEY
jgi:hypothetical protein